MSEWKGRLEKMETEGEKRGKENVEGQQEVREEKMRRGKKKKR